MRRYIILVVFILILASLTINSYAESKRINVYNLPICKESSLLNLPLNKYSFWFYISNGINLIDNCYIILNYSYSKTLIPKLSLITIFINGYPIFSGNIVEPNKDIVNLKLKIPISRIKRGYNEISISTRQRSVEGLCEDLDNDANWILLHNTSLLHLETSDKPYKISYFPYPFIDPLNKKDICNFVFYLPKDFDDEEVEVLLYLANAFALNKRYENLSYKVSFENPYTKKGENQILIGKFYKWQFLKEKDFIKDLDKNDGLIYISSQDNLRLYISGDGDGIWKSVEYITNELQIRYTEDNPIIIKTTKEIKYGKEFSKSIIKLEDLGIKNLILAGAYHQGTSFLVKLPLGFEKIGKGSFIEIHFSHSPVLDENSIITAYINGIPIKSERLDGKNVENGSLKIYFPENEFSKEQWTIDLKVYHSLKNAPCDKRFEEVAWTKIDSSSLIYFVKGYEDEYPNLRNLFKGSEEIYIWLGENTNPYELSVLATIVGKVGQNMGLNYKYKVIRGNKMDENIFSKKNIIFVGSFEDERIKDIEKSLWIIPSKEKFKFRKELSIYFDGFNTDVILQVDYSPLKGILYSIFYNKNDSLLRLKEFLSNFENINKISGQITVITSLGNIYSETLAEQKAKLRFIFEIKPIILYLLILLCIIILSIILIIWNRKR